MVEHRSEKPGVDSSILSLGISFLYRPYGAVFYIAVFFIKVAIRLPWPLKAVAVAVAVAVFRAIVRL